ncbi:hypothetical protein REPUB_Repub08aG0115200 [Reevesia pubescens]
MGRDYWYWGNGTKTSSISSSSKRASERYDSAQTTPSGCITAVFHLFDFHHFHFPFNHQTSSTSTSCSCFKPDSFLSPHTATSTPTLEGAEAPRNSLESEEEGSTSASLTSNSKEEETLNISMGIQIRTSGDTRLKVGAPNNDTSSEISSSPGTKTPTLVARLMGLDLLPESRSPSFSSAPNFQAKSHLNHHIQPLKPLQSKITSHRKSLDGDIRGTRSLPETPRISSARSDVDHHHRLSLQINKENMSASEELVISRLSSLKRKDLKHEDENRNPGHYARQIVKQVKESVSRKVGMDITNTVRNREEAREELVSQFKYKKLSRTLTKVADDSSPGKHSTPSCSPRLRFLESKSKPVMNSSTKDHNPQPLKSSFSSHPEISFQPQPVRVLPKPKLPPVEEEKDEQNRQQQPKPRATSKCKKGSSEKFGSRLKKSQQTSDIIRNKQEEPFVRPSTANRVDIPDRKCRKTPLSHDLLNNSVPTLLPVKKDPSPSATKIPQKQVLDAQRPKRSSQLSSCSSQTYNKQEATHLHVARDDNNGDKCNDATTTRSTTTTSGDEAAEYEYIARILRRAGLDKDTPVASFTSWFSPSHPLDPSIFYYLEHFTTCSTACQLSSNNNKITKSSTQLSHRCNRKLLFYLVDEILIEILKPNFNMKPWVISSSAGHIEYYYSTHMDGCQLIETLCSKIRRFPQADCLVLEDIDVLIDKDLPEMKLQSEMAFEEEGEGIVNEIEKDILEALVHETAVDFGARVST